MSQNLIHTLTKFPNGRNVDIVNYLTFIMFLSAVQSSVVKCSAGGWLGNLWELTVHAGEPAGQAATNKIGEVASLAPADCCGEGKALLPGKAGSDENCDWGMVGGQEARSGSSLYPDLCNTTEKPSKNRE